MNALTKLFYLVLLVVTPFVANSQSGGWLDRSPEERAEIITAWMERELALSDEQTSETYDINLKYAKKAQELKGEDAARAEKFRAAREHGAAKDEELKKVFTREQYSLYLEKKKELRKAIKER